VDFLEVDLDKPVLTKIPIVIVGESKGVKVGGLLKHMLYDLKVEASPLDIPDKIEVDITELDINDVVHVSDLVLSDKVKVLTPLDVVVAGIGHPTKEEVVPVEAVAGEEAAEEAGEEAAEKEQKEETEKK
jgi:large subunit ribosomal protein L25